MVIAMPKTTNTIRGTSTSTNVTVKVPDVPTIQYIKITSTEWFARPFVMKGVGAIVVRTVFIVNDAV